MILFYLNNQSKHYSRIIRNLYRSYTGKKQILATQKFSQNAVLNKRANIIVFAGMLRGDGLIYQFCKQNNKSFIYIDHAYIDRGYNAGNASGEWMRLTYNAFTWSKNLPESNDRWNLYFGRKYQLKPWNMHGGNKILVLPPSEATKFLFPESVEWTEKAIQEIKKHTSDKIHIREKPDQPVADPITNQVIDRKTFHHEKTIDQDMMEAKLIVTFNSAVPVLGTINGIPCYCSPHAAAYPMNIDLNNINNPPEPRRQEWLNQLVYHQYNTAEMKNGEFWNLIQKYYV
jgi:hypothetical protein